MRKIRGVAKGFIMLKPTKNYTFQIANNKGADQTARMRRLVYASVVRKQQSQGFSRPDPYDVEAEASCPPSSYAPENACDSSNNHLLTWLKSIPPSPLKKRMLPFPSSKKRMLLIQVLSRSALVRFGPVPSCDQALEFDIRKTCSFLTV